MKNVLITGAGSFIAKAIAVNLKQNGYVVFGTSSSSRKHDYCKATLNVSLGKSIKNFLKENKIDTLIHCAYDKNDIDDKNNTDGTILWGNEATETGVSLQIFLSSVSARCDSLSSYGRSKYLLEQWFSKNNHISLRLGLVFGYAGVFGNLVSLIKKLPFIPMLQGGNTNTMISDLDTVVQIIVQIIKKNEKNIRGKVLNLHQEKTYLLKDIVHAIKSELKTICIPIPVPYTPLYVFIKILEKIRLNFGVNSNNLKGIIQNSKIKLNSNLKDLGHEDQGLIQMTKKYL